MKLFFSTQNRRGEVFFGEAVLLLLLVVALLQLRPVRAQAAAEKLWSFVPAAGYVDTSPAVADVDGDGVKDLILATTAGRVLALDAKGHTKWFVDLNQPVSNPPAVAGNPLRVFVLTNPGAIVCLNAATGEKLWDYHMANDFPWGMTAVAVADLKGDGRAEVVAGDQGGHLVCLGTDGRFLWKKNTKLSFNSAPALADLDGDGRKEILIGARGTPLVCFSDRGKERWRVTSGHAVGSSPIVCDINGDRVPDILLGQGDGLSVYDGSGNERWHRAMKGEVHDAISVADVDRDGKMDIVVADLRGEVACLSGDGALKWKTSVGKRVRRSPAIADVDGDSKPEILVGGYSDALSVFDGTGHLKETVPLNGGMNASPTVADFRGDGRLSVICATISDVVALSWASKPAVVPPLILWGEYRLNSARTGSTLHTTKVASMEISNVDYGALHVGVNEFRVTVRNPKRRRLTLFLTVQQETGSTARTEVSSADSLFSARLPYTISGESAQNVRFSSLLKSGKKQIARRKKVVYLVPFAKDAADLHKTIAKIRVSARLLHENRYVRGQVALLTLEARKLDEQVKIAGTRSPLQRGELRTKFEQAQAEASRLEALAGAAAQAGKPLAAYAANPWAPFGGVDEIIEGRTPAPNLAVEAFWGETESAAVNLANFSDHPVVLRVEPEDLFSEDSTRVSFRQVLEFHQVLDVPTHSLDLSADALPKIGQGRTLILPAMSMRQLWLNVKAGRLAPGRWKTRIHFRTLETTSREMTAALSIQVWPIKLTPKQPLRLCQWGYVESSMLKDMVDAALKDQVEHGTNVFVASGTFAPHATFDAQGNLGPIDFTAHDAYVRRYSPYGLILFGGYQGSLKGPAAVFSPIWEKAYKKWISAWVSHLSQLGLSHDDFAFYPVDEPGLEGEKRVNEFVGYARPIRELDPTLKMYTDPTGEATMRQLKKMAPFVDIWCPNRSGFLLHSGGKKLDFIKSTGKTVWTYECRGDAKHQSPLGYYRGQAWLSFYRGLTGIGFWSYCTSQFNPWYVPRGGQDYLLVYPGNGVVSSKRWEAVRDGVEDYNILAQLKEAVENPPKGISPKVLHAARAFLSADAQGIAAFCGLDKNGTLPGVKGLRGVRKVEDERWQKITKARRKMARLLMAIQNKSTFQTK